MPEPKRPLKVFLCHASADKPAVRDLYKRLTADGVHVWLDKENLLPGQDWEFEIQKAVRESDVVIVCLSQQFNQKGFRQKEVRLALDTAMEQPEGEIFIIPARLEECETLPSLRKWHWVDLFEDNGYDMLMRALRTRANKIGVSVQSILKIIEKEEQDKKIKLLQRQARSLEESGNIEDALKVYYEIENIDPFVNGIEQKILELQKKIRINKIALNLIKSSGNNEQMPIRKNKSSIARFAGIMSIVVFSLAVFIVSRIPSLIKETNLTSTPSNLITATLTFTPSLFETPVSSLPTEITDEFGVQMMLVSEGEFTMGSEKGEPNEEPVRLIYLDAYYIDKYEVTNRLYKVCVDLGKCMPPSNGNRLDDQRYLDWPVVYVDWYQSNVYCEWRGANLPSEAQWEKLAAHNKQGFSYSYPWGEGISCSKANYYGCVDDTTKVGNYEIGRSIYGLYDMAGNVAEWVADWKSETYYLDSPLTNPTGPDTGVEKVQRGGSFANNSYYLRSASRLGSNPLWSNIDVGFRCAKDATP